MFETGEKFTVYKKTKTANGIGGYTIDETVPDYDIAGYLDLLSGVSGESFKRFSAVIVDATHVLLTDIRHKAIAKQALIINKATGDRYRVLYADNPVGMNHHLEIFVEQVV